MAAYKPETIGKITEALALKLKTLPSESIYSSVGIVRTPVEIDDGYYWCYGCIRKDGNESVIIVSLDNSTGVFEIPNIAINGNSKNTFKTKDFKEVLGNLEKLLKNGK